jgi:hypothetical protein
LLTTGREQSSSRAAAVSVSLEATTRKKWRSSIEVVIASRRGGREADVFP